MKKYSTIIIISFFISVFTPSWLCAQQTVTLKPVNGAGKDALLTTQLPNNNYGNHPEIEGITWTCSSVLCLGRSLIEFDLSFIPSGSTINSATLNLYANPNALNGISGQPTYGSDNAGFVRRVTQSWNQNTVTWNNQPITTTQNEVVIPQSISTSEDYSLDVTTLTQDIIDNPTAGFGFMISEQNETTWYNSLIFGSSDNTDTSLAPGLTITYTPPDTLTCIELQPGPVEGKDVIVTTQAPGTNYETHPDFEANTWTCSSVLCLGRSFIQFDLSSIPSSAHIDSAFLFLYADSLNVNGILGQPTYGSDNAGVLRLVTQSWIETTITWNTQPTFSMQDEVVLPQSTSTMQDYILDIKNIVQTSVQYPTTSFGFMMMELNETTWYNSLTFGSSDAQDVNIRPKLKICYSNTIGLNEINQSAISIYPNPFSHAFTISDSRYTIEKVEVFNLIGELVIFREGKGHSSSLSIDASALNSGVYFARILTDQGSMVKKLVKN